MQLARALDHEAGLGAVLGDLDERLGLLLEAERVARRPVGEMVELGQRLAAGGQLTRGGALTTAGSLSAAGAASSRIGGRPV